MDVLTSWLAIMVAFLMAGFTFTVLAMIGAALVGLVSFGNKKY